MPHPFLQLLAALIIALYCLIFLGLAIFGAQRFWLVHRYFRPRTRLPSLSPSESALPTVLVQIPLYNERYVACRLLEAVGQFDYPREFLQIQILDDSSDDTTERIAPSVSDLRAAGWNVEHVRRPDRIGYKAGALAFGMSRSRSDLIAIFDADFLPPPDFLMRTVGYFRDPQVGMVQSRWSYLNERFNLLTRLQAIMLDGHFMIDHGGRFNSGCFFNFNGTAGVWRRRAIEDAGGWTHDTVTEDLDLSYRAQLKGWKFLYCPHLQTPSELPVLMSAFKSQQYRWTKGASQTARRLLGPIWQAELPVALKFEATFHLLGNVPYILMVALAILLLPVYWLRDRWGFGWVIYVDLPMLVGGTFALASFYTNARRELGASPWSTLAHLPALMALGMGLAVNNTWAAVEGLRRSGGEFVRTPKFGVDSPENSRGVPQYRARRHRWIPWLERILLGYLCVTCVFSAYASLWWAVPFLLLFVAGYAYVVFRTAREHSVIEEAPTVQDLAAPRAT